MDRNDAGEAGKASEHCLPNFCSIRTAFALVLLSELLAFVLTLAAEPSDYSFWSNLGLHSLFIIWVALTSAAVLCGLRKRLEGMNSNRAGLVVYAVIQGVTLLVGWLAYVALPEAGLLIRGAPAGGDAFRYLRNFAIASLVAAVWLRYLYVQHQWLQQTKAESEARLDALQARMRPHFLFNSLNTIASLTRQNPSLAEDLVLDLAELFRAILKKNAKLATLAEEINLTRQYLNIEQQRLGERLKIAWNLDHVPPDALVPPLSLQPLVENAVYHGIEPSDKGGSLEIHGQLHRARIVLTVRNTLPERGAKPHRQGNREALENLRLRLQGCFPEEGQILTSVVDDCYQARIVIPCHRESREDIDRG